MYECLADPDQDMSCLTNISVNDSLIKLSESSFEKISLRRQNSQIVEVIKWTWAHNFWKFQMSMGIKIVSLVTNLLQFC